MRIWLHFDFLFYIHFIALHSQVAYFKTCLFIRCCYFTQRMSMGGFHWGRSIYSKNVGETHKIGKTCVLCRFYVIIVSNFLKFKLLLLKKRKNASIHLELCTILNSVFLYFDWEMSLEWCHLRRDYVLFKNSYDQLPSA